MQINVISMALHGNQCSSLQSPHPKQKVQSEKKVYIRIVPQTYVSCFFTYHFADSIFHDCANSFSKQELLRLIESEMNWKCRITFLHNNSRPKSPWTPSFTIRITEYYSFYFFVYENRNHIHTIFSLSFFNHPLIYVLCIHKMIFKPPTSYSKYRTLKTLHKSHKQIFIFFFTPFYVYRVVLWPWKDVKLLTTLYNSTEKN